MKQNNHIKIKIGLAGEDIACKYLVDKGYKIIERNFRNKIGELDIVCKYNSDQEIDNNGQNTSKIVFVEVKTLTPNKTGLNPEENVTFFKQKKLIRTCKLFLATNRIDLDSEWQIDVVSIFLDPEKKKARIRHTQNAVY
ncbi:MAG: YraN family protein [Patescibacteria group bacterium]